MKSAYSTIHPGKKSSSSKRLPVETRFYFLQKHRLHILHFPNSTGLFTKPTGRHDTKHRFSPDIAPHEQRNGYSGDLQSTPPPSLQTHLQPPPPPPPPHLPAASSTDQWSRRVLGMIGSDPTTAQLQLQPVSCSFGFPTLICGTFHKFLIKDDRQFSCSLHELQPVDCETQPVHLWLAVESPRSLAPMTHITADK